MHDLTTRPGATRADSVGKRGMVVELAPWQRWVGPIIFGPLFLAALPTVDYLARYMDFPPVWLLLLLAIGAVATAGLAFLLQMVVDADVLARVAHHHGLSYHSLGAAHKNLPQGVLPEGEERVFRNVFSDQYWRAGWYEAGRRDRGSRQKIIYGATLVQVDVPLETDNFFLRAENRRAREISLGPYAALPSQELKLGDRQWTLWSTAENVLTATGALRRLGPESLMDIDAVVASEGHLSLILRWRRSPFALPVWQLWPFSAHLRVDHIKDHIVRCAEMASAVLDASASS